MGSSLSAPQKQFLKNLQYILKQNSLAVQEEDLIALITAIDTHCPWFPEDGTWELDAWDKVGSTFHGHPHIALPILNAWCKVRVAFSALTPKNICLATASEPAPTNPTAPVLALPAPSTALRGLSPQYENSSISLNPLPPAPPDPGIGTGTGGVHQALVAIASWEPEASSIPTAFPVFRPTPGGQPQYAPFEFQLLKELKAAVSTYGISSPYAQGLLDNVLSLQLIPEDIKLLARTLLTPSAAVVFGSEWEHECMLMTPQILQQYNAIVPAANRVTEHVMLEGLVGKGALNTPQQQVTMHALVLNASTTAAKIAFRRTPDPTSATQQWGSVRQGPTEPYATFMDRLMTAIHRQISNPDAQNVVLRQLAFENANEDCRAALRPIAHLPGTSANDMLKACQSVGTEGHKAKLFAAALANSGPGRQQFPPQVNNMADKVCFGCGKKGHFRAQCRSTQTERRPATKCPLCKKGFHWANQCRSRGEGQGSENSPSDVTPPTAPPAVALPVQDELQGN